MKSKYIANKSSQSTEYAMSYNMKSLRLARAEEAKLDPWSSRKTGAGKIGSLRGQRLLIMARAEKAKLDPWSSSNTGAGKIGSLRGQRLWLEQRKLS